MKHCVACKHEGYDFIKIMFSASHPTIEDVTYDNGAKIVSFPMVTVSACPKCGTVRMDKESPYSNA
jgi:hypothetical protein